MIASKLKLSKLHFYLLFIGVISIVNIQFTSVFAQKKYTIVLDAGHGGKDSGNLGNGFIEKDIALNVTLLVGEYLSASKDIKIIYTRTKDDYPTLWERGEIANKAKADVFISIHCDSYQPNPNAYGAGTFVLGLRGNQKNLEVAKRENAAILLEVDYQKRYKGFDPNSVESLIGLTLLQEENLDKSLEIASLIQKNFSQKLNRNDRKVKQDNFQVLRETIMPSVLVELGFLTNYTEGRYLNSKKGQQEMAKAIADAIEEYINHLKINTVSNDIPVEIKNKEKKVEETNQEIYYKVQIASGKNKLEPKPQNFSGLKDVNRVKVESFYKYYYGLETDYEKAVENLKVAQSKGFTSAFIVAFKNDEIISIEAAKKMQQ